MTDNSNFSIHSSTSSSSAPLDERNHVLSIHSQAVRSASPLHHTPRLHEYDLVDTFDNISFDEQGNLRSLSSNSSTMPNQSAIAQTFLNSSISLNSNSILSSVPQTPLHHSPMLNAVANSDIHSSSIPLRQRTSLTDLGLRNNTISLPPPIIEKLSEPPTTKEQTFYMKENESNIMKYLNESRTSEFKNNLCDVVLVTESEKFHAHRSVLASCSSYFQSMFQLDMQERDSCEIDMMDTAQTQMTADGLRKSLEFIYTSRIVLNMDCVIEVLRAAHYLQLQELLSFCCEYLVHNITDDNWNGCKI